MKSINKLKRLTGEDKAPPKTDAVAASDEKLRQLSELRRRIEHVTTRLQAKSVAALSEKRQRGNRGLVELLDGTEIENEHGRFFLVSDVVSGSSRHGSRNLAQAFDCDMTAAGMLANNPAISRYSASDALFLDTETTGLSGGSGTMPFLIGLGWFEQGAFHVHQLLARDFGEEKAALAHLEQISVQKKFLVTFNGKAFDVNLLTTRFILNRLHFDLSCLPHLDLLHPSRRILGHRLDNCRLSTLEERILGVQREGDIPGSEIPQRYFDWLRRRNPGLLADIFEHNRLDVISMATLMAHLAEILCARASQDCVHKDDYLAAARLRLDRADSDGAKKIMDTIPNADSPDASFRSQKKLAELCRRTGRIDRAVNIWRQMAKCDPSAFYPVSELAKYLEHHQRDFAGARSIVEKALASGGVFSEKEMQSLKLRLRRLDKKIIASRDMPEKKPAGSK